MSITAYKVEAVGHDRTGEDYGYVNIMYRYGNKQSCPCAKRAGSPQTKLRDRKKTRKSVLSYTLCRILVL